MISPVSDVSAWAYQNAVKPAFFSFPADRIHETLSRTGEILGKLSPARFLLRQMWAYADPVLEQTVAGISFPNPIGLSAGFDYNAQLTQVTPDLGFGWHTIGTITHGAYDGNPPPMLGRLPLSRSLWVNKGFKNLGAKATIAKLTEKPLRIPTGISIGATNRQYRSVDEQIHDYELAFREFESSTLAHLYYELNISCPNLSAGSDFQKPAQLKRLLLAIDKLKLGRPVFVKMPIDTENDVFLKLIDLIATSNCAGVIIGNLTKDYKNPALLQTETQKFTKGGFSGKPTFHRSNEKIKLTCGHAGKRLIIVGTGGIFTAEDAYYKIRCGATLLQLITGMIYQGPQVIGQINRDLSKLLQNDGFSHISEAIGVE